MTSVRSLFSEQDELKAIDDNLLNIREHPTLPYRIFSYSKSVIYTEGSWDNPAVRHSRGLVVDDQGIIVARPWSKFFNYGEERADKIGLDEPVTVMDKTDGSLAILYPTPDGMALSSRGSFISDQANHATQIWRHKYNYLEHDSDFEVFTDQHTLLFEVIYPSNRIVVDYGDLDDLVLLGAVHIEDGSYLPSTIVAEKVSWPGLMAEVFPYKTIREALQAPSRDNAEGFIVMDNTGTRLVKYKYEQYLALHRLYSNLTPRNIWKQMFEGMSEEEIVGIYPDEFKDEVRGYIQDIKSACLDHAFEVSLLYDAIKHIEDQKDFAREAVKTPYAAELFQIRKGMLVYEMLMKRVYPPAVDKS